MALTISPTLLHFCKSNDLSSSNGGVFTALFAEKFRLRNMVLKPSQLGYRKIALRVCEVRVGNIGSSQLGQDQPSAALHRLQHFCLAQAAEVKGQADVRRADNFDNALENSRAGFRSAENSSAVAHHRVVIQVAEDPLVHRIVWSEILRLEGKNAPTIPVLDHFRARLRVTVADVNRIHRKDVFVFDCVTALTQRSPIYLDAQALLLIGRDPRQRHQMIAPLPDHLETFRIAVRCDVDRRVWFLTRLRINAKLREAIVLALPFELNTAPRSRDDVERLG